VHMPYLFDTSMISVLKSGWINPNLTINSTDFRLVEINHGCRLIHSRKSLVDGRALL
jgi:hypothetical protein